MVKQLVEIRMFPLAFANHDGAALGGRAPTHFILNLRNMTRGRAYKVIGDRAMQDAVKTTLNWLIGQFELFGFTIQNWMLLIGGVLLVYIVLLAIARRQDRVR